MKNISDETREDLRLRVDENNLLEEWQGQAAMMLDYSIKLADARMAEDEARAELLVVVAEMDGKIREDPEEYGLVKATEGAINAAIPGTDEHIAATTAHREARHAVRVLDAAVTALDHRKRTLQGMTDLWLRQYYSDPKSPAQPQQVREEVSRTTKEIPGRRPRKGKRSGT